MEAQGLSPFYEKVISEVKGVVDGERDLIANTANIASLVYYALNERTPDYTNWLGFYFVKGDPQALVLGPFQGKVACIRIAKGKGVCGTAWETKQTILVKDVHEFPGHIACDSASNSEIVAPIVVDGEVVGVFDIDSPTVNGLTEEDKVGLTAIANIAASACDWK